MITTTLRRIRAHGPCGIDPRYTTLKGYQELKAALGPDIGDDDPIPFARIVDIMGLDYAALCCRVEPQYAPEWRLFSLWCARRVEHRMIDKRSRDALNVAERYANGQATDEELSKARAAAYAAWAQCDRNPALVHAAAAWAALAAVAPSTALAAVRLARAEAAAVVAAADPADAWAATAALMPCAAYAAASWSVMEREDQTAEFLRIVTETEARS